MKYLLIILTLLMLISCASLHMQSCRELCGINGVKYFTELPYRCVCDRIQRAKVGDYTNEFLPPIQNKKGCE